MSNRKKIIFISFTTYSQENWQKKINIDWEAAHHSTWQTVFAAYLKEYHDDFDIECWQMYSEDKCRYKGISVRDGTKNYGLEVNSKRTKGIKFKMFPAKTFLNQYISFAMLSEVKKIIKNKEKVIFHLQSVHGLMNSFISFYCSNTPLVAQQRGPNMPPSWKFKFNKNPFYILLHFLDKFSLNNINYAFASSIGSTIYLSRKLGPERVEHLKGGGFNFEKNQPFSKKEMRKELDLPLDKKIMIYVGRYNKLKGVDRFIDIFTRLKKEDPEFEAVFIGGNKYEAYYDKAVKSGGIVKEYIPKDLLLKYMCATDIHIMPTADIKWIPFSDISTASLESLALNQPVVSPTLIHFLGSRKERDHLSSTKMDIEDIIFDIKRILSYPEKFKNTRKIVEKYYNWERIINKNVKVYNRLFNDFYDI